MSFYTLLARLIEYPTEALMDNLTDIPETLNRLSDMSTSEKHVVLAFAEWLDKGTLLERQATYVNLFDITPEHSLHITHHLYGESKERGPALANLVEYYRSYGFDLAERELPDYLPVILEFISGLDDIGAKVFLADASKALVTLRENLANIKSPYADMIQLLEQRGSLAGIAA